MRILQDNQLMESPNEKIGINDIVECWSWTVEPHGVYFVARQLAADGVANHEDHTIETQVENVEQAFKKLQY